MRSGRAHWRMTFANQTANRTAAADIPPRRRSLVGERPKQQRGRRTNDPLATVNLNTAQGRRVADLTRAYLAALGGPVEIDRQAAVVAAAELQVLAEEARAAALREGASADLDRVVRMQGAADRALRRLGIKPGAQPKTQSLAEYLASRAAASPVAQPPRDAAEAPSATETPHGAPQRDDEATESEASDAE
jgi:hypothetical protein